jgi:hypothetical protein
MVVRSVCSVPGAHRCISCMSILILKVKIIFMSVIRFLYLNLNYMKGFCLQKARLYIYIYIYIYIVFFTLYGRWKWFSHCHELHSTQC